MHFSVYEEKKVQKSYKEILLFLLKINIHKIYKYYLFGYEYIGNTTYIDWHYFIFGDSFRMNQLFPFANYIVIGYLILSLLVTIYFVSINFEKEKVLLINLKSNS